MFQILLKIKSVLIVIYKKIHVKTSLLEVGTYKLGYASGKTYIWHTFAYIIIISNYLFF